MNAHSTMLTRYLHYLSLIIISLLLSDYAYSQEQALIDSLLNVARTTDNDSVRAVCYRRVAFNAYDSDTIAKYANLGIEYATKAGSGNNGDLFKCYYRLAENSYYNEQFTTSVSYLHSLINIVSDKETNPEGKAASLGSAYYLLAANYDLLQQTDSFQISIKQAMQYFTEIDYKNMLCECLNSMGSQSANSGLYVTALDYYQQALTIAYEIEEPYFQKNTLIEIANVTFNMYDEAPEEHPDRLQSALGFARQAHDIEAQMPSFLPLILNCRTLARAYHTLYEETDVEAYVDSCNAAIAEGENLLRSMPIASFSVDFDILKAKQMLHHNQYREALRLLEKNLKIVQDESLTTAEMNIYELLPRCYEKIGDYHNAYLAENHLRKLKQSFQSEQKMRQSIEYQQQLIREEEMRQVEIDMLRRDSEMRRQRLIGVALIFGLGLSLLLIFVILRSLKEKKRTNEKLNQQNEEIAQQRDQLNETNKQITASINYAHLIQNAAISSKEEVRQLFPESFVYYQPKNIVSGDWYRVAQCGEYRVLVVADCTGHGVPGAMLSMLGISALKEILADITQRGDIPQPAEILNRMRVQIIESLGKSDNSNYHAEDGMDVAVMVFMPDNTKAIFAGAKQDLYLVRDGVAQRIRGDGMPIGRYVKVRDFSQVDVELQNNDMIYLFSDGIKDQFGAEGKFLIKRQTAFFENNALEPVDKQYELLKRIITAWRGDLVQTDDQTMVGVKIHI